MGQRTSESRAASSATNINGADVFVGAALSSTCVRALTALNQSYYQNAAATPSAILIDHQVSNPDADRLRRALVVQ